MWSPAKRAKSEVQIAGASEGFTGKEIGCERTVRFRGVRGFHLRPTDRCLPPLPLPFFASARVHVRRGILARILVSYGCSRCFSHCRESTLRRRNKRVFRRAVLSPRSDPRIAPVSTSLRGGKRIVVDAADRTGTSKLTTNLRHRPNLPQLSCVSHSVTRHASRPLTAKPTPPQKTDGSGSRVSPCARRIAGGNPQRDRRA